MITTHEQTVPIAPVHQAPIEALRRKYHHTLSSHAFVSLYLWREEMRLSLYLRDDCFSARCGWKGENAWFFPCGSEAAKLAFVAEHGQEPDFRLCYLREADRDFLQMHFPQVYRLVRDENSDEYLYDRVGHLLLRGGRYANVRTQVHRAERDYALTVQPLDAEACPKAVEIVRQWASLPHPFVCGLNDDKVDEEAIKRLPELQMQGVLVSVNAEPYAVCAGFPLSGDTFDLCVAKCRKNLPGLSYYAKRALFQVLEPRFTYINLEEDLGIPGLREMKQLLAPVQKNEIWEATRL